jgi:tetratricopeptide (TPR) repeat protein
MARRHSGILTTTAFVLGAAVTVGCSNTEAPPAAAQPSTPTVPTATKITDLEELEGAPAPPVITAGTGPVAFADGEAAYKAKNYAEATKLFARYAAEHPKNAWGRFMLGLSAWKSGDPEGAEEAFNEALVIDPKHVKSLVNLSRVLLDQNRAGEAFETLMKADALDAASKDVPRLLGRAFAAHGKTEDAIAAYRRAIEIDAKDCWAMNNLGLLFLEGKRAEEALPLLMQAIEIEPGIPAFHNNLGMALEHMGDFKAAAEAYKGALAVDPSYEKAKQNLTRVEQVKE